MNSQRICTHRCINILVAFSVLALLCGVSYAALAEVGAVSAGKTISSGVPDLLKRPKEYSLFGTETDPQRYLKHDTIMEKLDVGDVDALIDMLANENYKHRWYMIVRALILVADKKDERAFNAVLSYIKRPEKRPNYMDNLFALAGKYNAIEMCGLFELESAHVMLRDAFTREGAKLLLKNWDTNFTSYRYSEDDARIHFVRG